MLTSAMRRIVLLLALGVLTPTKGSPQAAAREGSWRRTVEGSGNVLFGSARGRLLAGAAGVERADSTLEFRADGNFTYADTRREDEGDGLGGRREVTARSSRAAMALDYRPFAQVSPFWFGATETSLQQRVARRWSSGAGAKLTLYRRDENEASVSLAMLYERTRALDPDSLTPAVDTRARWSLRTRFRRRLTSQVYLSHVTFYQPTVGRLGRYTADSNTSIDVTLVEGLALTATLRDRYDSEARRRGAASKHDGQLLFGLKASF